ncbi:MAG TPA: VOC family protein [Stellaceae bacterium]|nr:VOC family protein [Stellaceae bacterium]
MMADATLGVSPLWPAALDHLRLDSPDPKALAAFYARALGMSVSRLDSDLYLAEGHERRLVIGRGEPRGHPWSAFALQDDEQLERYRRFLRERGAEGLASPTPLFAQGGFALRDPDGRLAVFGVRGRESPATVSGLPGRLQHVVVASERFPAMMAFYRDVLGFLVSDTVHVDDGKGGLGEVNVCFLRGNLEHHSFAVFRAPQSASDHFALEVPGWDDIRDWADHFAAHDVGIWWGPGRHGAGNNLFFMVKDPDGNNIEISAELERLAKGVPGKRWPAGGKALNLWGPVWVRDTAS